MKSFLVLLTVAALAHSSPVPEESVLNSVVGKFINCMNSDVNLCVQQHSLNVVNRLLGVRKLKIIDGVTILNSEPREAKSLSLSSDLAARKQEVNERLWQSVTDLLQSSELEFSYGGDDEGRALGDEDEGRGLVNNKKRTSKKKLKMLMPLAYLVKAKFAALAVFFLGVLAVSIWKLAIIAKIAFIAKLIAIIKQLLAKKNEEHGGWAPPVHDDHGHGHGWESQGWGRSGKIEGADMAYAAYKQQ